MAKPGEKVTLMLHEAVAEWLTKPELMKAKGVNLLRNRKEAIDLLRNFPEETFFVIVPVAAGPIPLP